MKPPLNVTRYIFQGRVLLKLSVKIYTWNKTPLFNPQSRSSVFVWISIDQIDLLGDLWLGFSNRSIVLADHFEYSLGYIIPKIKIISNLAKHFVVLLIVLQLVYHDIIWFILFER